MNRSVPQARIVIVTCGNLREGRKIAHAVVTQKLAACVNIVSAPVESIYRWKGSVESAKEYLLIIKSSTRSLSKLQMTILGMHSYDVPEFLVFNVSEGSQPYLSWLLANS
jgi:periplasmic divalent cation tolerance protein